MQKEIWKDVVGYEGYYQISNFSRVKSLSRHVHTWNGGFIKKDQILKSTLGKRGYFYLNLCSNGIPKTFSLHRILMKSFVLNPENKPCVNHKNGIKNDNRLTNLEWCTYAENNQHAYDIGIKQPPNKGRYNMNGKPIDQYNKQMIKLNEFKSINEAERETGINQCCIGDAIRGIRQKTAGGFIWKLHT